MTGEELGLRIKALRWEKKMKQSVVAEKMGITVGAYIKIEGGKTKINIEHLNALSKIFDVHIATFFADLEFLKTLGITEMTDLGNDIRSMIAAEMSPEYKKK